MLSNAFAGKKNGFIAGLLIMVLCLPISTVALAASAPSVPESLTAVAGNGQVGLIWFAPEDDGGAAITGYHVSMDGGLSWTDVGPATTCTYTGLTGGILYTFGVRAVNGAGYGEEAIVTAKPKDANPDAGSTGSQTGQVITGGGGGGGGIIVEPLPPEDPPTPPTPPPEDDPPPKEETPEAPQPEDYLPIEIDPEEVTERPFRPKREKMNQAVTQWTIMADSTESHTWINSYADIDFNFTLVFAAAKVGGDTVKGHYDGGGHLLASLIGAGYAAVGVHAEYEHTGPLTHIALTLEKGGGETDAKYKQAMEAYKKADDAYDEYMADRNRHYREVMNEFLIATGGGDKTSENYAIEYERFQARLGAYEEEKPRPPKPKKPQHKNAYAAKGKGTLFWDCQTVKNIGISKDGSSSAEPWPPMSLECEAILYENGTGIVKIWLLGEPVCFKAHLVKSIIIR